MATTSNLKAVSGTADWQFQDTVTQLYEVQYDSPPTNFLTALVAAQTASGTPVPSRGASYGSGLYALSITGEATGDARQVWHWSVNFAPPPIDENPGSVTEPNPLERPVIYNVEYMDREYVVEKAKNVQTLSHGDGKGGNRAANTLGPIVNAAGRRPDEPIVETERLEVLVVRRYYPTLSHIVNLNRTYKRTTNSDAVVGYQARQLRYLLTESQGLTIINGIEVWPGVTNILAEETTDLVLDNVGYDFWNVGDARFERAKNPADGEPTADPINLKLDGDQGGDNTTTITYRHLADAAYGTLLA